MSCAAPAGYAQVRSACGGSFTRLCATLAAAQLAHEFLVDGGLELEVELLEDAARLFRPTRMRRDLPPS